MKLFTVLALAIAVCAVIFASQNSGNVAIYILNLSYQSSMGLVVLLTFSAGVLMGLFVSVPPMIGRMTKISNLKKIVEKQDREIAELNRQLLEISGNLNFSRQQYASGGNQYPNDFSEMSGNLAPTPDRKLSGNKHPNDFPEMPPVQ